MEEKNIIHSVKSEYIFKQKFPIWTLVTAVVGLIVMIYKLVNHGDGVERWFTIFYLVLICILILTVLWRFHFFTIVLNREGMSYRSSSELFKSFSWHLDWQKPHGLYSQKKPIGKILTIQFEGNHDKSLDLNSWVLVSEDKSAIQLENAINQFSEVQDYLEMPNSLYGGVDLGVHALRATIFATALIVLCVLPGWFVHRYMTIGEGTPFWMLWLGGSFGMFLSFVYLLRKKAHPLGLVPISLLNGGAFVLLTITLVKFVAIVISDEKTLTFELIEKDGGYHHWRAKEDRGIQLKRGSPDADTGTSALLSESREIRVLESSLPFVFLKPNQLEKLR